MIQLSLNQKSILGIFRGCVCHMYLRLRS